MPDKIKAILDARGQRFALAILTVGYTRTKLNYAVNYARGIPLSTLTLGEHFPQPDKNNQNVVGYIFDAKNNAIAYFRRGITLVVAPTNAPYMQRQTNYVFGGYLFK